MHGIIECVPQYHRVLLTYYLECTVSNHVPSTSGKGWSKALDQGSIQYGIVAVPLSVDVQEVALVPNPVPVVTVKGLVDPQGL